MKPEIYEGNENYIFISYAHKDSDTVLSIVNEITQAGFRIWYDDGIAAGSEWPETIANHLDRAAAFIAFISPNSVISDNCRNEINFALSRKKPFLSVFIEDTEVPLGIELQIAAKQGVIRSKCRSRDEFLTKIIDSEIIAECRRQEGQIENTFVRTDGQEATEGETDVAAKSSAGVTGNIGTNRKKLAIGCAAVVLLIVAVLVMNNLKNDKSSISQDLTNSVNTASEDAAELAESTEKNAETSSLGTGDKGEGTASFDYSYDYPSFSGKEITVSDARALENALKDAGDGDTIIIQSGEYETDRTLFISKRIRLCGVGDTKPVIHSSLRVRTGEVMIDNIEIDITDSSQTYDSEYREDRLTCIEIDGTDMPTYFRDIVLKSKAGCQGINAYGGVVMENSYIDTDKEAIFLTAKGELKGNTLKSSYCGVLIWGLYGKKDNPDEKIEEFRNNNTIQAPIDIECREE